MQSQSYSLELTAPDLNIIKQWQQSQPKRQDSLAWILERSILLDKLYSEGYLLSEISVWNFNTDTLHVQVDPGNKIYWAQLSFRALEFLPPNWVDELNVSGEPIKYNDWHETVMDVLRSAQEEGYLFATYKLNILDLKNDSLQAEVIFEPGLQIVFDTIEIEGNAKLAKGYLEKSSGFTKGQPVTLLDLELLKQHLDNLKFVQQVSPPILILFQEKATVRVFLNNRQASSFDVLAGFQPASANQSSIAITGYVELDLVNQLSRGERVYLHLEKLRPRSQDLELSAYYPYLLDLPFGLEGEFRLVKNDTLFSDLHWKGNIVLPLGRDQYLRAGLSQQSTNLISINRNAIISSKRLPAYIDLRINGFNLGLVRNRLDYELNPRRGYSISLSGSISQKRVKQSSLIEDLNRIDPDFDYTTLYDTLHEPSSRFALEGAFQYFIPWGTRSTIRLAVEAGALESGDRLFINEMFRLGGYSRLRGFDEESIFAQFYSIFSAEYRLIISQGSYVSLFSDYAWVKSEDVEFPIEDRPYGVGIGLTLETKAGIFGMRAAVGSQLGNALDFNAARIHFGYVNRF